MTEGECAVEAARAELDRLLDRAATALAPARFVTEPARPALGPCVRAGDAGARRMLANRYSGFDAEGCDDRCEAARIAAEAVARLWQDLGLAVRRLDLGSLGHEVTAIAPGAGILVFGVAAAGMTLGGETACVPKGTEGQVLPDRQ